MRFEIWGNSIASGYLALRLKKIGADVLWVRTGGASEFNTVRPLRIGRASRDLFRDLQASYTRPFHLWNSAESFSSWAFEDELNFKPIALSVFGAQEHWIKGQDLRDEILTMASIARIPMIQDDPVSFKLKPFSDDRCLQVIDFAPEQINSHRGIYFPEKLARPVIYERTWELAIKEASRFTETIGYFAFAGAHGILENSSANRAYLSLQSPSVYGLDRAEMAVSEPRGAAPMRWKALFLQSQKIQYQESPRFLGPSHMEISGVAKMAAAIGTPRPWSNLQVDQEITQAERLFRQLYKLSSLRDPTLELHSWNQRETQRCCGFFQRAARAERMIYSVKTAKLFSSASMLLPTPLRNYLNLPV